MQEIDSVEHEWPLDEWGPAPTLPTVKAPSGYTICPYVGVRLPKQVFSKKDFQKHLKRAWYTFDPRSWDMLPLVRDQWFEKILENWEIYNRRIRLDMTPRLKEQTKKLLKKGGLVLVIGGRPAAQGDGKSIGALMFIDFLREEFGVDVTAHILWEHSHMQIAIDSEDTTGYVILDIDEDLTATGEGSKTILIEISNTWQTNRKPKLIIISVGIDPGHSHPAVNIHLIPAGINERFQATRFGMFAGGIFVGWVYLQRKFTPEWQLKFGTDSEMGTAAEYPARAEAHSRTVMKKGLSAYPPQVEQAHIEMVMEWLELDKREVEESGIDWKTPSVDVMVTETKQVGLPTKNMSYPRRICATALRRFTRKNPGLKKRKTETVDVSQIMFELAEFWEDYQKTVYSRYPDDYVLTDRDAWMVTYRQMGFTDAKIKELLRLDMRVNSVGERIRKGVSEWNVLPSKTQFGTIAEKFIGSRLELSGLSCTYVKDLASESARKNVPDISDTGNTRNAAWAINVKTTLRSDFDEIVETSPEHLVKRSWAVWLFPKLGKMATCEITGETTRFDSRRMVLTGIDEGITKLKEMIERV